MFSPNVPLEILSALAFETVAIRGVDYAVVEERAAMRILLLELRKRRLEMLALLLVAGSCAASTGEERAQAAGATLIGTPAPRLVLKTIDGQSIDLGSLYGKKAVYLKFWATWCVPCRQQMPHFERTFKNAGADLAVIAINAGFNDSIEDVRAYRQSVGLTMPIVIDDGRLAAALNLRVTPQHIVIGRDGRVQYIGHLADERLDAALLSARRPAVAAGVATLSSQPVHRYAVGDHLPALTATTLGGAVVPLGDPSAARPTVLVFLSPWCESYLAGSRPQRSAACRAVREQVETLANDSRIRWLGIASGLWASEPELAAYRDESKVTIPLALDESGALFRAFGVTNVPSLLLVDAQGRIVRRIDGPAPQLAQQLAALTGP
jgi:peroxiredoxin